MGAGPLRTNTAIQCYSFIIAKTHRQHTWRCVLNLFYYIQVKSILILIHHLVAINPHLQPKKWQLMSLLSHLHLIESFGHRG